MQDFPYEPLTPFLLRAQPGVPDRDKAVFTAAFEEGDQTNTIKVVLKKIGNDWKIAAMKEN